MVNFGTNANDYFQSDASLRLAKIRELKCTNTLGNPLTLPAKILALKQFVSPHVPASINAPYLLVADAGFSARIVSAETGTSLTVFKGHTGPVTSTAYYIDTAADDTFVFTGSWDKSVKKWSVKTGACVSTWNLHQDFVKSLALSPDAKTLYSGSSDKTIRQLNLATGKSVMFKGHTRGVEDLIVADEGKALWSCSSDGSIRKWDTATGTCTATLTGHDTSVYALFLDDETLWSASADKSVKRWPIMNDKIAAESSLDHDDYVKTLVPIHSAVLATGCRDEKIRIFDMGSEALLKILDGHFDEVSALCLIGSTLYSGSLDCTLRSWSVSDILDPKIQFKLDIKLDEDEVVQHASSGLTEEEERELAELMSDDE
ncbi:hypothetical protein AMAG_00760 [Allomyces macrogynus ATCC 38327]|uniref:Uncharacterized protein n=1 Tax=Allomyces macrogynus (strain ATCC 38327) TaxID=578462 RepID=A0A0L0RXF5_ALLM3|nr:hypothetical protein AMAG_00760 [Allomyces macrogynus ATCC 38327]|eukprot:KNE54809.1 hypothetical protein AMAG_00760 [Allomyces macrogynus ATCC 38327]